MHDLTIIQLAMAISGCLTFLILCATFIERVAHPFGSWFRKGLVADLVNAQQESLENTQKVLEAVSKLASDVDELRVGQRDTTLRLLGLDSRVGVLEERTVQQQTLLQLFAPGPYVRSSIAEPSNENPE